MSGVLGGLRGYVGSTVGCHFVSSKAGTVGADVRFLDALDTAPPIPYSLHVPWEPHPCPCATTQGLRRRGPGRRRTPPVATTASARCPKLLKPRHAL